MRLISNFKKKIECVATLGAFDGIHQGHLYLVKKLIEAAKASNLPSLLITFWPHPEQILNNKFSGCITNLEQKIKILKSTALDYFLVLKTSPRLLRLNGERFLEKILELVRINKLVVGEDFRFGYKAANNVKDLISYSKRFGFHLQIIKKKKIKGRVVSSSLIRKLIRTGLFSQVRILLGRDYTLEATIEKGRGLGRKLGYPTINLKNKGYVLPKRGVYAVKVYLDKTPYLGICNIGTRPTVSKEKKISIEAHLLNFKKRKIKGSVKIIFLERIRNEKKFPSQEKLKEAIKKDIEFILPKYGINLPLATPLLVSQ
jgi:riboflavin kinase/FMN adenylyltransferase